MEAANDNTLAADLLKGADAIADYTGFDRRSVYHFASKGGLPTFRVGALICARKTTLMAWISEQETAGRAAVAA
ncbi:DNA-binding protein [Aurantimonas sp. C2-5-R2]|uniref:DNA-binding protein n=1 Tax=Aurantimonas sp. C2-5-R2 TaxID=3113713 RepID=UPI002F92B45D